MGLFDFLFKKKTAPITDTPIVDTPKPIPPQEPTIKRGILSTKKLIVTASNIEQLKSNYIALDLETTGLNPITEKIIEVGLVKFQNGEPIDSYNSLIMIDTPIPLAATKVNHITDNMLNNYGKSPEEVYKEVVDFIGDSLDGITTIVAHNAKFDTDFLIKALSNYGYNGNINYIDTLEISRDKLKDLSSHKQQAVADYFGIKNDAEHRAKSDAEVCGKIFFKLLDYSAKDIKKQQEKIEKASLSQEEKEICAIIKSTLAKEGQDASKIKFYKNSASYIDIMLVYTIFKFKISKKGNFFVLPKEFIKNDISLKLEDCTKTENDYVNKRVYFENPLEDIEKIKDILVAIYKKFVADNSVYDNLTKYEKEFMANATLTSINDIEIQELIDNAKNRSIEKEQKAADLKAQQQLEEEQKAQKIADKKAKEEEKILAEEQLNKLRQLHKEQLENAESYTPEIIDAIVKLSESSNKRAIIKLDDDSNILKIYNSVSEASTDVGIAPKTIRDAANGKYKHGGGFCWKYADEYLKEQN